MAGIDSKRGSPVLITSLRLATVRQLPSRTRKLAALREAFQDQVVVHASVLFDGAVEGLHLVRVPENLFELSLIEIGVLPDQIRPCSGGSLGTSLMKSTFRPSLVGPVHVVYR
jgi:hypothetical protein